MFNLYILTRICSKKKNMFLLATLAPVSMHQKMHTLSETQAGSTLSTCLTFACVVFLQRTPYLQPQVFA